MAIFRLGLPKKIAEGPTTPSVERNLPVIAGIGRRWFLTHLAISLALGFVFAEAWWRLYAVPRRDRRDAYFCDRGVTWTSLID